MKSKSDHKVVPGMNPHIDRLLALYPDDSEIFKINGDLVLMPAGSTLEEARNG